jgi:hypothetical protein
LLTGTRSPLRSTSIGRRASRSAEATAPSATHHERWTCRPREGPARERVTQAQQDEVAAERGVDAQVMVLHLQGQKIAAECRRHAAEEVGVASLGTSADRQRGHPRPLVVGIGVQAPLDEQADQHRDDDGQEGRLRIDLQGNAERRGPHQPVVQNDDFDGARYGCQRAGQRHARGDRPALQRLDLRQQQGEAQHLQPDQDGGRPK